MKLRRSSLQLIAAITLTASVCAQVGVRVQSARADAVKDFQLSIIAQKAKAYNPGELKEGLIVEDVAKGSGAEKMGFVADDVILSWSRGEHHGLIESPLDLLDVEIEELPRGAVTLEGLRGSISKSWVWLTQVAWIQEGTWGVVVRPNFTGSLLTGYQAGRRVAPAGKKGEATEHWQATAREAENQRFPRWLAGWVRLRLAESLAANKDVNAADLACRQAVELVKNDSALSTKLLRACGDIFLSQHADEQAQAYYREALAGLEGSKPVSLSTASVLTELGRIAYAQEESTQAVALIGQALKIQEQLVPESLLVAINLNRIGAMLQDTDLEKSKEYLLRVIALREKISPNTTVLSSSLHNLGNTLVMSGDPDKAEPYHLRALKLLEELQPNSDDLARCFVDLANGAGDRGDLAKAEEYYRKAIAIQRGLHPRGGVTAASLNNLGGLLQERGQLLAAEESFKQSLEIKQEKAPGSLTVADTLNNLGGLFADRGDLERAENYMREALLIRLKKAPESTDLAYTYLGLGDLAWQRQDLPQTEEYYRRALAISEKAAPNSRETGYALQRLGDAAWKRGDAAEAETNYLRALKIREHAGRSSPGYADTLLALAEVALGKQQREVAGQRFEQGLEALELQTARLGGADEIRANFRAQHEQKYREYVDLLLAQKHTEHALDVLERSRARTLLETLAAAHVDVRQGGQPELIAQERSLQARLKAKSERRIALIIDKRPDEQIKAVEKEISDLTTEYQDVEAQLRSLSPSYAALTQPQPLRAKEIQERLLDEDSLLLEYSLGEQRSYVFAVSRESLLTYVLPPRNEIEQTARRVYELLTARNHNVPGEGEAQRSRRITQAEVAYLQAARQLSRMILAPIAGQLHKKRLLVVADGALHYIPFAALPEPQAAHNTGQGQRWPLALNHEIVNLPSASILEVLRKHKRERKSADLAVAVFADPVFDRQDARVGGRQVPDAGGARPSDIRGTNDGEEKSDDDLADDQLTRSVADMSLVSLPRLQKSREEARSIVATVPAGQALLAIDFGASRAAATAPGLARYRIVHFATHGLINSKHPELSGLVLSLVTENGTPQNGFLGLQDIYNLNLPVDLVVLSACQTALGRSIQGEGVIGLTRGFMYAGASRVVASLWEINDEATAKLMASFYQSMQRGMTPAAALRNAQIAMWRDKSWNSPYYWAAFQIQGEWK